MLRSPSSPLLRPKRFPLKVPVQYRVAGEQRWNQGSTHDMSCTGMLLDGRHHLRTLAPVEIKFQVPPEVSGGAPLEVLCRGYVARILGSRLPLVKNRFGVAVADYRLLDRALDGQEIVTRWATPALVHEVLNLLEVVQGNTELALDLRNLPREARERLGHIKHAAERISELLRTRQRAD